MQSINGATRFRQIAREIEGISDRMLSKELKELETNKLIQRTVYDAFPPTVAYEPTAHTHTLQNVIHALREWGYFHRKEIMGK